MQVEVIPMLINSDFMNVPLDKLLHLTDYKMYGKDSYVFQQKELLHGLYECTYLSMNDKELSAEALDYLLKNNKNIGEALSNVYGIERKDILSTLSTMSAVINSSTAMSVVINSSTAMSAVANSSTAMSAVINSSTAMSAVINSSTAMSAVANSSTAMSAVANSSTAMSAVINSSTAMSAVINSSAAMSAVANSSTAMSAVVNSSTAMSAVINSSTAMARLSTSSLRKRVNNGQKATGLMLPMSLGGNTYFYREDIGNYGRIEYVDSSLQTFADGWTRGYTNWGDVLRQKPLGAKLIRVFSGGGSDNWVDIILISGTITNI